MTRRVPLGLLAISLVVTTGVVVAPAASAGEERVHQARTLTPLATDWQRTVTVDRFDPALGELLRVEIEVVAELTGTLRLENTTDAAVAVDHSATATVRVARAGSPWSVQARPTEAGHQDLEAFDGALDFTGPSAVTATLSTTASATIALTEAADLAPFVGTGTIGLVVGGLGTWTGDGAGVVADAALLAGADVQVAFVYLADERPPDAPTITSAPPAVTNDLTPTIAFTAVDTDEVSTTCKLDRPGLAGTWVSCSSPWTAPTLPAGSSGQHAISVRATDPAGNTGVAATVAFVVDVVPPSAPTISAFPVSPSRDSSPTWSFSSDADATTTCWMDGRAPVACPHAFTADLDEASDGTHTLSVVATDAAGNPGPVTTASYVLDRAAPAPPVVLTRPASPSSDPTPTWTFDAEPGTMLGCSIDGAAFVACDLTHTADLTAALDGPHTFAVRATDAAGNVGEPATEHYVLDRVGPGQPSVVGPTVGNDSTPTFTITAEPGARLDCQIDLLAPVPCDAGTFEPVLTVDAVYVLTVTAADAAGNRGLATITSYRLDTTPPPPPELTGRPPEESPDDHPSWTFTLGPGRTGECAVDAGPWVPCADSFTADLAAVPDGVHSFAVRAIDQAGNVGAPSTDDFRLDRDAPAAPRITEAPATPGRRTDPTWTFDAPPESSTECSVNGRRWRPCTGSITVALDDDDDGDTVEVRIRARDTAGNRSDPDVGSYTLDLTSPPAPVLVTAPPSPANRPNATWNFTVEPGSEAECALDGGAWEPCAGSVAVLFPPGSDGRHTVAIRTTDAAGNVSGETTGEYLLDTTPPPAPVITGGPAPASTDDTPTWTFASEPGSSTECRVDDGPWSPCGTVLQVDLTTAIDGIHAIELRAIDAVGNTGPVAAGAYLLDRSVPNPPTFTEVPPTPGQDPTPTWSFSAEEGAATECSFAGDPWTACNAFFQADLEGEADGTYELAVRTTDAAGNRSDAVVGTYRFDTTSPPRPSVAGPAGAIADATPEWHIVVDPDAAAECRIDGGAFAPCGGLFTRLLADGSHQLEVRSNDAAGNASPVVVVEVVVDTVPPPPPSFGRVASPENPTWEVVAAPGASAECSIDGGPWVPCNGLVGDHTTTRLDVRSVDAAGNRSSVLTGPRTITSISRAVAPTVRPADPAPPAPPAPLVAVVPAVGALADLLPLVDPPAVAASAPTPAAAAASGRPETALGNLVPVLPPEVALIIQNAVERSTLPMVLIFVVVAFVAIQDRLDRRDPKLAQAPLRHEPEYLEFR